MKTVIRIILVASAILFAGCVKTEWRERREPTTDAERTAIATYVEKVMAATPRTRSGHDQDWDDAIVAAHHAAAQTFCRHSYWEWRYNGFPEGGGNYTGRYRYAEEAKP